jgi:hypothetical protein
VILRCLEHVLWDSSKCEPAGAACRTAAQRLSAVRPELRAARRQIVFPLCGRSCVPHAAPPLSAVRPELHAARPHSDFPPPTCAEYAVPQHPTASVDYSDGNATPQVARFFATRHYGIPPDPPSIPLFFLSLCPIRFPFPSLARSIQPSPIALHSAAPNRSVPLSLPRILDPPRVRPYYCLASLHRSLPSYVVSSVPPSSSL